MSIVKVSGPLVCNPVLVTAVSAVSSTGFFPGDGPRWKTSHIPDTSDGPRGHDEAILRPTEAARRIDVARRAPAAELAPWVDYYWRVRWTDIEPHDQPVIPQSCIHVAAENGRLFVHGINRRAFMRTLVGTGHVIGASFRPGCFRPFMRQSVRTLTDRVVPAGEVTGVDDVPMAAWLLDSSRSDNDLVDGMNRWLLSVDIEDDRVALEIADLVSRVEQDRSVVRAEQLAAIAGVSLRTLQRRFVEYVGIGPKWVIQRCRMLDVAAAVHSGEPVDFAVLATELGFSDQPHLTRAWTALVGSPPATYRSGA